MPDVDLTEAEIQHATYIEAHPSEVYEAFTDPDRLNEWFTTGATGTPATGETMHFAWEAWGPDEVTAADEVTVIEASPPDTFVFQWYAHVRWGPTTVELSFEGETGGTVVRVRESGYDNAQDALGVLIDCATGWGEALTLLKLYVERGVSTKTLRGE